MLTKIRAIQQESFDAVLLELPSLCDSFTCYPSEHLFIVSSERYAGVDFTDAFNARKLNTDYISVSLII